MLMFSRHALYALLICLGLLCANVVIVTKEKLRLKEIFVFQEYVLMFAS